MPLGAADLAHAPEDTGEDAMQSRVVGAAAVADFEQRRSGDRRFPCRGLTAGRMQAVGEMGVARRAQIHGQGGVRGEVPERGAGGIVAAFTEVESGSRVGTHGAGGAERQEGFGPFRILGREMRVEEHPAGTIRILGATRLTQIGFETMERAFGPRQPPGEIGARDDRRRTQALDGVVGHLAGFLAVMSFVDEIAAPAERIGEREMHVRQQGEIAIGIGHRQGMSELFDRAVVGVEPEQHTTDELPCTGGA